jgi:Ala-tRNA(Pro) deacylase
MVNDRLKRYLDQERAAYETLPHREVFTAREVAAASHAAGRHRLSLVREDEISRLFPDCEIGAMPPFGHLYGMPVYVDACFPRAPTIVFPAGNHHEVVRMPYAEYVRLVKPVLGEFCLHEREKDVSG